MVFVLAGLAGQTIGTICVCGAIARKTDQRRRFTVARSLPDGRRRTGCVGTAASGANAIDATFTKPLTVLVVPAGRIHRLCLAGDAAGPRVPAGCCGITLLGW